MPFSKDDPNINRYGRPKEPDKVNDVALAILKTSLNSIKGKVKELSTTQNIKLISVLLPYTLPKLQNITYEDTDEFSSMNDMDIEQIMNRLMDGYNRRKKL